MARSRARNGENERRSPAAEEEKEEVIVELPNEDDQVGVVGVGENGVGGHGRRGRDAEDRGQQQRNVRQNLGPPRPEWSRERVTLTTANLIPKPSATSGVQPVAQINPRADLISLTELVEGGGRMRTVMVAMIMSIVSAESAERSIVKKTKAIAIKIRSDTSAE